MHNSGFYIQRLMEAADKDGDGFIEYDNGEFVKVTVYILVHQGRFLKGAIRVLYSLHPFLSAQSLASWLL